MAGKNPQVYIYDLPCLLDLSGKSNPCVGCRLTKSKQHLTHLSSLSLSITITSSLPLNSYLEAGLFFYNKISSLLTDYCMMRPKIIWSQENSDERKKSIINTRNKAQMYKNQTSVGKYAVSNAKCYLLSEVLIIFLKYLLNMNFCLPLADDFCESSCFTHRVHSFNHASRILLSSKI